MIARKEPFRAHSFEYACALTDIDHRLTKPKHPWTNVSAVAATHSGAGAVRAARLGWTNA
jgi:hypothetical protein